MTFNELLRESYRTHPRLSYPERAELVRAQLAAETEKQQEKPKAEPQEDQKAKRKAWLDAFFVKGKEE